MDRILKTFIIGHIIFIFGIFLRYMAFSITWPDRWKFQGLRQNTTWAIYESAVVDISLWLSVLGGAIILMAFWFYLNKKEQEVHYI